MKTEIKLKIADTVIKMESRFPLAELTEQEKRIFYSSKKLFKNFIHTGKERPDILIRVMVEDRLPQIRKIDPMFVTYHFQDGRENWHLQKKGNTYIYRCLLEQNRQSILINKTFDKATAYLLPMKNKGKVWDFANIIYDFLQVLLINYFALHKKGIFVHGIGVKDLGGKGLLFAGKSGAGKTTTARLWHKHSQAMVLNDDRIIIRKNSNKFFIYGSPWHGEFSDYLSSRIESAPLEKLFFIYHAPENLTRRITQKEAFNLIYPALFPTLWDKESLENIVLFCNDLIRGVPCYQLGFVNDKRVIRFVREIE